MNYVLFFPDELRAETLSCYGNNTIQTPNFDRLADEGVLFEQCHVQNPVCTPSRCSLFTGQYVHVNGHRTLWNLLQPHEHNLLRYMKEAGYEVRVYGKNDLLSPEAAAISTDIFEKRGSQTAFPSPLSETGNDFLFAETPGSATAPGDYQNLKAGMDFIRNRKPDDKPFFLFLPLTLPHCPYTVPAPYYSMYQDSEVSLRPQGTGKPSFHERIREYRDLKNSDMAAVQRIYRGMTSYTDMLLGELMDCINACGIEDDTMLIASADHGDYAGDYGLVEKWPNGCEDVLTRVPLMVKAPGMKAGHRVGEPVELFDIMATVLDSAGIPPKHTYFARSFLPQLTGLPGDPERAVFCEGGYDTFEPHCSEGARLAEFDRSSVFGIYYPKALQQKQHPESVCRTVMVRTLTHKLIRRSSGECELYDLAEDPKELTNLYDVPAYTAVRHELEQRLLNWYLVTSDAVPFEESGREF